MPAAFVDHSGATPATYYVHADQVMRPRKLTDGAAAVLWDRIATPFGDEHTVTGTLTQKLQFPGQIEETETDFFQNWHRDYDPALGRYVQSDPIGLYDGPNTYAYVANEPITFVDPTGLGKVGFLIKGGKGVWRYCTKNRARKELQNGGDVLVKKSGGTSGEARRLAKEQFGKKTVRHDAHQSRQKPHFQHKNGGKGHVFYSTAASMTFVGAFGDNWATQAADFVNPISDAVDIVDLISEINNATGDSEGASSCDCESAQ